MESGLFVVVRRALTITSKNAGTQSPLRANKPTEVQRKITYFGGTISPPAHLAKETEAAMQVFTADNKTARFPFDKNFESVV
mmetsp:Transcript_6892/g.9115  ORF Transcript_6892/g.9115 Transcript_6892/m.9115 type:complete len:82 (-) Transcript_6892:1439-1684(-)